MIATYRGVKYDTAAFAAKTQCSTIREVQEVYRGVKHTEKVRNCK